ncbi:uncharacterized protein Dh44 [Drosophila bipectinata]|uniref:uncharacterized protein Dh44 n=1 Tax=Drosophila bipectinata TaxID=42026 RepID=UPI001C8AEE8F|nr:uncharacterized protein LOC108119877 isoform X2 [Drosophila bipectinata]KAH8272100.1 hypothetical protein KR026_008113 [Drosophila bipectinata]
MMKATAWFCPVLLTLLCATRLVCTAQRGVGSGTGTGVGGTAAGAGPEAGGSGRTNGYPLDYPDARNIQDDFLLAKRNKPSLSIVNPLDVLRQRLLLEIARRQMKENSRQVELNRAILKNVGKRFMIRGGGAPKVTTRRYREREREWEREREPEELQQLEELELEQEQQQELEREQEEQAVRQQLLPWKHFPSQLWSYGWTHSQAPYSALQLADSLQQKTTRPQSLPGQKLPSYAKKSLNVAGLGLGVRAVRGHRAANGNEAANETTNHDNDENENGYGSSKNAAGYVDSLLDEDGDGEAGFDLFEEVGPPAPSGGSVGALDANEHQSVGWDLPPYRFHKSQQHNVN